MRNGQVIETGKDLDQFHRAKPREILGNWLISAAVNHEHKKEALVFASDPDGGRDGFIVDRTLGQEYPTEHILVPRPRGPDHAGKDSSSLILEAIEKKRSKGGLAYASGKTLVVMLNRDGGKWEPNHVARNLPTPLLFEDVWVVGLVAERAGEYIYGVSRLDLSEGKAPSWLIWITRTFRQWCVFPYQRGPWSETLPLDQVIKSGLKHARLRSSNSPRPKLSATS